MQDELNDGKTALMHSGMRGKEKDIAAFVAYWSSMRKGHAVPRRSDIDPRGIESLLGSAFIAEKIAPGLARMRIAGTHLSDLMGMEVRGMPISSFILPEYRDELADLLVGLFDRPAILKIDISSDSSPGCAALTGTIMLLPLRSDLGDTSRALGCLVTNGIIGRTPRRFSITGHGFQPVQPPRGAATGPIMPKEICPGFAEKARPYLTGEPQHPSERPYLRLISSQTEN